MPAVQPPTPYYRKVLLSVIYVEAAFVIGVFLLGRLTGRDPLGGSYGDGAAFIAGYVFMFLVLPAFVLALIGRWMLIPATAFAAAAAVCCILPFFDYLPGLPDPIQYGTIVLIGLALVCAFRLAGKRRSS